MEASRSSVSSPLDLLSEVHHLLGSGRELGDLLEHVAEILVRGYGAQGAQVWRVDGDAASPVATAWSSRPWAARRAGSCAR